MRKRTFERARKASVISAEQARGKERENFQANGQKTRERDQAQDLAREIQKSKARASERAQEDRANAGEKILERARRAHATRAAERAQGIENAKDKL